MHLKVSSSRRCFLFSRFYRPVALSHKVGAASQPNRTKVKSAEFLKVKVMQSSRSQKLLFKSFNVSFLSCSNRCPKFIFITASSLQGRKHFYYSIAVSIGRERLGFSFFPSRRNNKTADEVCKTKFLWLIRAFCSFTIEEGCHIQLATKLSRNNLSRKESYKFRQKSKPAFLPRRQSSNPLFLLPFV